MSWISNKLFLIFMSLLFIGLYGSCGKSSTPSLKLSNFQEAMVVIGQDNFTEGQPNQNESITAGGFDEPYGNISYGDGYLYLNDYTNSRILGYEGLPENNGANADFVLGQVNFTSSSNGTSADEMNGPAANVIYKGKLFVLDYDNNRILIYNSLPKTTGAAADVVVGQPNFTSSDSACTASGLSDPEGLHVVDGKLIVGDYDNSRVLIWNTIPTNNGQSADVVLGQSTFTTCTNNDDNQDGDEDESGEATARTLNSPAGVWSDGKKLVVNDTYNNRTLIWNSFPSSNFKPADVVLGQSDFTKNAVNDDDQDGDEDSQPSARTMYYPYEGVTSNGKQLVIADSDNHRVLIWDTFPTKNFTPADVVLGQSDFTKNTNNDDDQDEDSDVGPSARTLSYPTGLHIVKKKLIVTDGSNHRYLIYQGE